MPAKQIHGRAFGQRGPGQDGAGELRDRGRFRFGTHRRARQHRDRQFGSCPGAAVPVETHLAGPGGLVDEQLVGARALDTAITGGAVGPTSPRIEQTDPVAVGVRVGAVSVECGQQVAPGSLPSPGRDGPALDDGPAQWDGAVVVRLQRRSVGGEPGEELPPRRLVLAAVVADGGGQQRPRPLVVRPGRRIVRQIRGQRVHRRVHRRVGPVAVVR